MNERIIRVGRPVPLVGMLTEPEQPADAHTAMLLLNSGVMHRVGTCRLSVRLARAVCSRLGIAAVRFDFSGVGDSEPRQQAADFEASAAQEVQEVMDFLAETRGFTRFVLYGLCFGGHTACRVGETDRRVRLIAQIDGHCYTTWRSYLRHYGRRLLTPAIWPGAVSRLFRGERTRPGGAEVAGIESRYFEVPDFGQRPRREDIAQRLQRVMANDIELLCIYTGNEPTYNDLNQFRECYYDVDFRNRLSLEHLPDSSHIVSDPRSQTAVIDGIVRWLAARVGTSQSRPA